MKTILIGGVGDGHEVEFSHGSDRLTLPFGCGGGICFAVYALQGVRDDGSPKLIFEREKHRDYEEELIFLGFGWEYRICRAFAATPEGIAFIAAVKAKKAQVPGGW